MEIGFSYLLQEWWVMIYLIFPCPVFLVDIGQVHQKNPILLKNFLLGEAGDLYLEMGCMKSDMT